MITVVTEYDDYRAIGASARIEPVQNPAEHRIHKTDTRQIALHGIGPLSCFEPPVTQLLIRRTSDRAARRHEVAEQCRFGHIAEIVLRDRRQLDVPERVHVEVFLGHEPRLVRTAKSHRVEARSVAGFIQVPSHPVGELAVRGRGIFGDYRAPVERIGKVVVVERVVIGGHSSGRHGLVRPRMIERRIVAMP